MPILTFSKLIMYKRGCRGMNGAEESLLVVGGAAIWLQTGARANEAHDDSEDNDSSSDLGAKQENLIKRLTR
jgi:hypothetical protein